MNYIVFYFILGILVILLDWFFFIKKEAKNNGSIFLLPVCILFWPIYLISIIICRCFFNKKNDNMKRKEKIKYVSTADLSKGFHPEILYEINKPYAEYVDFKEIN